MSNLSDISFPPVLDTSSEDIIRDFFNPLTPYYYHPHIVHLTPESMGNYQGFCS